MAIFICCVSVEPACCWQWSHSSPLRLSAGLRLWRCRFRGRDSQFGRLSLGWGAELSQTDPVGAMFQQAGWHVHRTDREGRRYRDTAWKNRVGLTVWQRLWSNFGFLCLVFSAPFRKIKADFYAVKEGFTAFKDLIKCVIMKTVNEPLCLYE